MVASGRQSTRKAPEGETMATATKKPTTADRDARLGDRARRLVAALDATIAERRRHDRRAARVREIARLIDDGPALETLKKQSWYNTDHVYDLEWAASKALVKFILRVNRWRMSRVNCDSNDVRHAAVMIDGTVWAVAVETPDEEDGHGRWHLVRIDPDAIPTF
jgi:hypothetical protein